MFVDSFELVRQRIDARDGESEVGIELVGDAEGVGLKSQAEQEAAAVECGAPIDDLQRLDIA